MAWHSTGELVQALVEREAAQARLSGARGGHWLWTPDVGWFTADGVPMATVAGRGVGIRRALWLCTWGSIPTSVRIVAHCVEATCVRPAHGHCGPAAGRHARAEYLIEDHPALAAWYDLGPGVRREQRGRVDAGGRRFPAALGLTRAHLLEDQQEDQQEDLQTG